MPRLRLKTVRLLDLLLRSSLFAASLAPSLRAVAEAVPAPEEESADYRQAVEEAVREFDARNYAEARALFRRAHALFPNARTERGLGFAEFELRNYPAAITHLQAALHSNVKTLSDELRPETEQLLARAQTFVGRVYVDAKPKPNVLTIDGVAVEPQGGGDLVLAVGEHLLEVRAQGFVAERRKLSIQGGEAERITILLAQQEAAAPPKAKETHKSWYKSPWLWASVGVVVAGAAAATGIVLTRSDEPSEPYGGSASGVLKGP